MTKKQKMICLALVMGALWMYIPQAGAVDAKGVVFSDLNGNGVREDTEPGISGVGVSNGKEVVQTDATGQYTIPVSLDTTLFVIKPSGYACLPGEDGLAKFYYTHKPYGTLSKRKYAGVARTGDLPAWVNFPLTQREEPARFNVLLFGDPQVRNEKEVGYFAKDILAVASKEDAAFSVLLGDIGFDNLDVYPALIKAMAGSGIPWTPIIGNHDHNQDVVLDAEADETYERFFGPPTYAFNYGGVHFIVLDNIIWEGEGYKAGLNSDQLAFLQADLALVPKDVLVVLMMHIPIKEVPEKDVVFMMLSGRPNTLSLAAHTHSQYTEFLGEEDGWNGDNPHVCSVVGTTCGSWWSGPLNASGVPETTMSDGTPNGYQILEVDGAAWKSKYRVAGEPPEHQMGMDCPPEFTAGIPPELVVNVYMGTPRSKVEMRVDEGEWLPMERSPREDPAYLRLLSLEKAAPTEHALPKPGKSRHIWARFLPTNLSPGPHSIQVKHTGYDGQVIEDGMEVTVRP